MPDVNDPGNAEMMLNNPRHLAETASQLLKRGIMPTEDGWGGWLGRYQVALCKATREIEKRNERNWVRKQERPPGSFSRTIMPGANLKETQTSDARSFPMCASRLS